MTFQDYPRTKVIDFGTNQQRICDFLLVLDSNIGRGPILPRFKEISAFARRRPRFAYLTPYFSQNLGVFSLE